MALSPMYEDEKVCMNDNSLTCYRPVPDTPLTRAATSVLPPTAKTSSFVINSANKSYKHQYANIYFVRLRLLRDLVEENAKRLWMEAAGAWFAQLSIPRLLTRRLA